MDNHFSTIMAKKMERTIQNLEKNNMRGYHVQTIEALHTLIGQIVPEQSVVSVGGSMTLFETGVLDLLRKSNYTFLDRYKEGLTAADIKSIYRQSFSADAYFCSSNAITEAGELYNVDGNGNRVAAMVYGPDKVIVIASSNKIVPDISAAIQRNRHIAAPANCVRLNTSTPCVHTGTCQDCHSPNRICCAYTTIGFQRTANRIHVIFIDGQYGY